MKKAQEIADSAQDEGAPQLGSWRAARERCRLEELGQGDGKRTSRLELKLIIKADVQGSVEAVEDALTFA